jgi:emp24/gp25L/p24 family/GOLD
MASLLLLLNAFAIPIQGSEVIIKIKPSQTRCIGENVGHDEPILVKIDFVSVPVQTAMTVTVESDEIHEDVKKTDSSTSTPPTVRPPILAETLTSGYSKLKCCTTESGAYKLCLTPIDDIEVSVKFVSGPNAKDYDSLGKSDHLEKSELLLQQVGDTVKGYYQNLLHLRERENALKITYDDTSFMVILAACMSVSIFTISTILRIFYFKRFFKAKKII